MSRVVSRIRTRRNSRIGALISSAPMTFARTGPAYLDGTEYASGVPRFPSNSGVRGVLVEEAGTNLLSLNQSSIETDTTGWAGVSTTLTRSTAGTPSHGVAALRLQPTSSGASRGCYVTPRLTVTAGTAYTFTCRAIKIAGGTITLRPILEFYNVASGGSPLAANNGAAITIDTAATTEFTVSATAPTGSTHAVVGLFATVTVGTSEIWEADAFDFKAKAYKTSWVPGGTTQNAETLTIPTQGLLKPSQGSVIIGAYLEGDIAKATPSAAHWMLAQGASSMNLLGLANHPTLGGWIFRMTDDGSGITNCAWSQALSGAQVFGGRWSASEASLWNGGIKRDAKTGSIVRPVIMAPTASIGSYYTGIAQVNTPIRYVYFYDRALSDAEMAAATSGNPPPDFTAHVRFTNGKMEVIQGHPWGLAESLNLLLDAPTVGPK